MFAAQVRYFDSTMVVQTHIKTTFEPSRIIQPIYTGGAVSIAQNGRIFAGAVGEEVLVTDLQTGTVLARIEGVRPTTKPTVLQILTELTIDKLNRMGKE